MSSRSFSPFSSSVFFSFCSRFARRGKEEGGGERCCCAGIEGSLTGVIKYTEAKSSRLRLLAAPSTTTTTLLNRIKLERTLHALHNLCSHSKKEISLLSSLRRRRRRRRRIIFLDEEKIWKVSSTKYFSPSRGWKILLLSRTGEGRGARYPRMGWTVR